MLKFLEHRPDLKDVTFHVAGIGVEEPMWPSVVDRPEGTGDWLFMYFYHPVKLKIQGVISEYPVGTMAIWSDEDPQYYGHQDGDWMHTWIHCQGQVVRPLLTDAGLTSNSVIYLPSPNILVKYLSDMYYETVENYSPDTTILQNSFHNLLRELARQVDQPAKPALPERMLEIKGYIDSHLTDKHTLASLAKRISLSVPHFSAEFKRCFGISPIDYLIRCRLQQARYLLYDHNLTVSDIATRVGYDDLYHFSKQFKKHFGASPRNLRQ